MSIAISKIGITTPSKRPNVSFGADKVWRKVPLSDSDFTTLTTLAHKADNKFDPTGALMGLFKLGRLSFLVRPFAPRNTFQVLKGIDASELPDIKRESVLFRALDKLTRLEEPLAKVVKQGDMKGRTFSLTFKGLVMARSISESVPDFLTRSGIGQLNYRKYLKQIRA